MKKKIYEKEIHIGVDELTHELLTERAEERKVTLPVIVREALELYLWGELYDESQNKQPS